MSKYLHRYSGGNFFTPSKKKIILSVKSLTGQIYGNNFNKIKIKISNFGNFQQSNTKGIGKFAAAIQEAVSM